MTPESDYFGRLGMGEIWFCIRLVLFRISTRSGELLGILTCSLSQIKNLPYILPNLPLSINVLQPIPSQQALLSNIKINIPTLNPFKVHIPDITSPRQVLLRPRLNHFLPI
jgi:hypothetical protein